MALDAYRRKRDFSRTPEPPAARPRRGRKAAVFVVQRHQARTLHYDFRLEVDGVLKSWAVPKGVPLHAPEKRLAVQVEDHPLSYATFHGDIPAGEYGAGHVDIFDHGTWTPKESPRAGLAAGKLEFELHGARLRGDWVLLRTRLDDNPHNWLLIKRADTNAAGSDRPPARAPARKAARKARP
jgi:bifunctional non-homologous end joining protein LigD